MRSVRHIYVYAFACICLLRVRARQEQCCQFQFAQFGGVWRANARFAYFSLNTKKMRFMKVAYVPL